VEVRVRVVAKEQPPAELPGVGTEGDDAMNAVVQALLALLLGQRKREQEAKRAVRFVTVRGPDGVVRFRVAVMQ